jgi:hypothetical protein
MSQWGQMRVIHHKYPHPPSTVPHSLLTQSDINECLLNGGRGPCNVNAVWLTQGAVSSASATLDLLATARRAPVGLGALGRAAVKPTGLSGWALGNMMNMLCRARIGMESHGCLLQKTSLGLHSHIAF